jgi:NADH dehydrogenase
MTRDVHAVTGALGYSGRHVADRLLARGARVRTLTGHPDRPDPFGGRVEIARLPFDDPAALRRVLEDVAVLVNTYWIRFERGATTFERAVRNSLALVAAARDAGIERIVHVSITNPDERSPLPYFAGKARVERAIRESGLSHAILRPAVFFGGRDVLVNNVAWLLRRLPVFGLAPGKYELRPIHVEDLAALVVDEAARRESVTRDAVGPESFTFEELVREVRAAVRSRAAVVRVPPALLLLASRLVGRVVGDVPLTPHEVAGLTAGLLASSAPSTGETRFTAWLREHGRTLGVEWASELGRHFG